MRAEIDALKLQLENAQETQKETIKQTNAAKHQYERLARELEKKLAHNNKLNEDVAEIQARTFETEAVRVSLPLRCVTVTDGVQRFCVRVH